MRSSSFVFSPSLTACAGINVSRQSRAWACLSTPSTGGLTTKCVCTWHSPSKHIFYCFWQVYHIITPQSPIITNENYEKFAINDYPNGFNAVVAVLSYTGYDMEDACIVNKASVRPLALPF